jgi:hypothetical protein
MQASASSPVNLLSFGLSLLSFGLYLEDFKARPVTTHFATGEDSI